MPLAFKVATLEGLDDNLRAMYKKEGDAFVLDLEGYEDPVKLKGALEAERTAAKEATRKLRDTLKLYEGMPDPEKLRAIMGQLENDEEQRLIAEGKLPEVVKLRTEKFKQELERVANEALAKASASDARASKFEMQVLKGHLTIEASQENVGVHPSAIRYIFAEAKEQGWRLNEDGEPRLYNKAGEEVLGKDGKTPYTFTEWLTDRKTIEENPTWYKAGNTGGGNVGNKTTTGKVVDTSKMSPEERMTHARKKQK